MDIVTYALLNGKIKEYASNVDKWLEENVDPATGYVLDRSLQMENAAAPADMVGDINGEVGNLKNTLDHKADVIYDTASGDIASFPDGADGLAVKDLTVGIEPVQDLHGYDYPWPSGATKNKCPLPPAETKNGVTLSHNEDGSITIKGTATDNVYFDFFAGNFDSSAYAGYYAYMRSENTTWSVNSIMFRVSNSSRAGLQDILGNTQTEINNNGSGLYFAIRIVGGYSLPSAGITIYPLLRASTENNDWIPYSNICPISGWTGCNISHSGADTSDPTVISISWQSEAGTVYGGTLDVTTGVLTVTDGYADLGTLSWGDQGTANTYQATISDMLTPSNNIVCSHYPTTAASTSAANMPDKSIKTYGLSASKFIIIKDSSYSAVSDFALAMSGVQLVYELATPLVIQLDPITVTTLLGQNNIFADCGPSTVEYPADTKLYIQKINTPTDDDMIADDNIASGQYFIVNNNLYISTAAILAGDPIKPGTNCTLTNLAAALNALNS